MKIGYVQTRPVFKDKERNFRQVADLLGGAEADLVVLPELFATGYTFETKREAESLAEDTAGRTVAFLRELARGIGGAAAGGFIEAEGGFLYNSAALVTSNGLVDCYRKIHLFNKEKIWFDPGNRKPRSVDIGGARIGMMICFDWIFPEIARTLTLQGVEIIAHPANLVLPFCQDAMITRCLENRIFAVTANRIGLEHHGEDSFQFTGRSQITGCAGEVLARARKDRCSSAFVDVDVRRAQNKRINPYNDLLVDRKPDRYGL